MSLIQNAVRFFSSRMAGRDQNDILKPFFNKLLDEDAVVEDTPRSENLCGKWFCLIGTGPRQEPKSLVVDIRAFATATHAVTAAAGGVTGP